MKGAFIVLGVLLVAATIRGEDYLDIYLGLLTEPIKACSVENGYEETEDARVVFEKEASAGVDHATCLRACTMKIGAYMHHSKINLHNVNTFIAAVHGDNPEMMKKLEKGASECVDKVNDIADECKKAYLFVECFMDKH